MQTLTPSMPASGGRNNIGGNRYKLIDTSQYQNRLQSQTDTPQYNLPTHNRYEPIRPHTPHPTEEAPLTLDHMNAMITHPIMEGIFRTEDMADPLGEARGEWGDIGDPPGAP